jgi:hypothetical protein
LGARRVERGGKDRTYAFEVIEEPRTYICELYFI